MKLITLVIILLCVTLIYSYTTLEEKIKIYIDYPDGDLNFFREEISNVNFVRFMQEADVYILFSKQRTGSGGQKYTVDFTGQKRFEGIDESLTFILEKDDTDDDERRKSVQTIKLGLIRYFSRTNLADKITISFPIEQKKEEIIDRWNNWVFEIDVSCFLSGQETSSFLSLWGSISANRVTKEIKIEFSFFGSYNQDKFDYGDVVTESSSDSKSFNASVIKSINDHWSYGLWSYIYDSSYSNIDLSVGISPGIEYNIFPYSESNRKQLRLQYKLHPGFTDYHEETIYGKLSEKTLKHSFTNEIEYIQSWGSVSASIIASQYLIIDDLILDSYEKNKLTLRSDISWRIFKGLSFNLWGNISRIHNQLSISAGDVSTEELLLQRKELETQYSYFASIGLSYSFGSIYNNIVNPRFGD
ncbi:MAG: hypothetical protein KAU01_00110 [Candidatus Cloacimonetes bacterium]|nr:hypothetical protein [Candidatus Cloacimonadota bacterium]